MPFRSSSQRRWMYANEPEMAKEWQAHTPKGEKLPEKVKQAELLGFLDELEKIAIDPASLMAAGMASHVGTNIVTKLLHHTKLMEGLRAAGLAKGIRESIAGKPVGAISRLKAMWLGPEYTATEEVGRLIGKNLEGLSSAEQRYTLEGLADTVEKIPEIAKTPILEDLAVGVNKALSTSLPYPRPLAKATWFQKVAPYLPAPLVAVTEPAALVHAGINLSRNLAARSAPGREFMSKALSQGLSESKQIVDAAKVTSLGLEGGALEGLPKVRNFLSGITKHMTMSPTEPLSRAKELAYDVLVSPAALTTRRIGSDLAKMVETPEGQKSLEQLLSGPLGTYLQGVKAELVGAAERRAAKITADLGKRLEQAYIVPPSQL